MSLFSKEVKMLEVEKLSIVRYTIAVVIDFHFHHRSIAMAALTSRDDVDMLESGA